MKKCMFQLVFVLQELIFWASPLPAKSAEDRNLLEFVREAHRASRESIQTYSCRVEFTIIITSERLGSPVTQSCSSQYWCSPTVMRANVSDKSEEGDYLWENFICKGVIRRSIQGQTGVQASRASYTTRHTMRCDPADRGLLVLNVPNTTDSIPFEQLVEKATRLKKIERKSVHGKEMIVVQLFFDRSGDVNRAWNIEIYFDPGVNYLIRKVVYSVASKGGYIREEEVQNFKEFGSGVFFPEQAVGRSENQGKQYSTNTSKLTDIKVNQPLPRDIFRFRYPQGVFMADKIRGCEYRIDAEGNPISKEVPFGRGDPPPIKEGDAQSAGTETQEEPRPASRWILPISLGILIVGGVAAFLRRRRRQGEAG